MQGLSVIAGAVVALVLALDVHAEPCPSGDLLAQDGVRASIGGAPSPGLLGRGFVAEGQGGPAATTSVEAPLVIDLGALRTIRALVVQAEADGTLLVESSLDGSSWSTLTIVAPTPGGGLRTRALLLAHPTDARALRVGPAPGARPRRLSALSAWCRVPREPPGPATASVEPGARRGAALRAQLGLALAGLGLFGWGLVLRGLGRPGSARRTREAVLAVLGAASAAAWFNFGQFHGPGFVHTWEHTHYFLGAKYFAELSYTRLYPCITLADAEDGLADRVGGRRLRDETNRIGSARSVLEKPASCRSHFSDERWRAFKQDVAWFRARIHPLRWERLFLDHGYNAPPVWTLVGSALTRHLPATDASVLALALLDPLLLAVTWGFALWSFGWRTTSVALLFWGTNQLAGFAWTGGAFVRQDWLMLLVVGIALAHRGFPFASGLALGASALLRIFPAFVLVGLGLGSVARALRSRRVSPWGTTGRIACGCLASVALLVALSARGPGGIGAWAAFSTEARSNLRSTAGNIVGLMTVLSYEPEPAPGAVAQSEDASLDARRARFAERRPIGLLIGLVCCAFFARAVRDEEAWTTLVLGVGLVPLLAFVASYYYGFLACWGLLAKRWGDWLGLLLCALSVATHASAALWPAQAQVEARFACDSLAVIVAALVLLGAATWGRKRLAPGELWGAGEPAAESPRG